MAKSTSAVTNGVSLPAEANSKGSLNEVSPESKDQVVAVADEIGTEPLKHPETDAFLPATYRVVTEQGSVVRIDR